MPDTLYDTRFFLAAYAADRGPKLKIRSELQTRKRRYVSAITIHEVYRISLEGEGRDGEDKKICYRERLRNN